MLAALADPADGADAAGGLLGVPTPRSAAQRAEKKAARVHASAWYEMALEELVRQVGSHCAERGVLLDRVCTAYRSMLGAMPGAHAELVVQAEQLRGSLLAAEQRRGELASRAENARESAARAVVEKKLLKEDLKEAERATARARPNL